MPDADHVKLTQRVDSRVECQQSNCNGLHWGLCPDLFNIPRLVCHYTNWLVLDNRVTASGHGSQTAVGLLQRHSMGCGTSPG